MEEFEGLTREELVGMILEQRELVLALSKEVDELRSQLGGGPTPRMSGAGRVAPSWVKPNRKEGREAERKKRKKPFVRRRETPTRVEEHALSQCPDCGRPLSGGTVKRIRQVIEIPTPAVEIIEHRFIARRCGYCGKIHVAKADLGDQVIGKHRVGMKLMSLIAYLSTAGRMTKRTIQSFIEALYGLHLGLGEISEILHTVASCGRGEMNRLLALVRGSPYINADETGWREDGLGVRLDILHQRCALLHIPAEQEWGDTQGNDRRQIPWGSRDGLLCRIQRCTCRPSSMLGTPCQGLAQAQGAESR